MPTKSAMMISPRLQAKELARQDEVRPLSTFFALGCSKGLHTWILANPKMCTNEQRILYFAFVFNLFLAKVNPPCRCLDVY